MKITNHLAALSVVAVLAVTGTVTSPVWADDGPDDECVPSLTSQYNPYCPDDTEPPYPTDTPTETPTTPTPTTPTPTTPTPTTPPPTTPTPTTPPPTTPTTPAPTTPAATTTTPAATPTPTTTVSPSTAATSSPTPEVESPTPEVESPSPEVELEQTSNVPVVQTEVVPTSINAGATEEPDGLGMLPLGLATLGGLLGLFALVLRRRHS